MVSNNSTNHFRHIDYIKITVFGFALAALWSSLHTIILPLRILGLLYLFYHRFIAANENQGTKLAEEA